MDAADRKVAIIIGCSLGGAALIFIIVLIIVCICARRKSDEKKRLNNSSISSTLGHGTDTWDHTGRVKHGQRLEGPQKTQFIRSGSQLWRTNVTLATEPTSHAVATLDKYPVQREGSTAGQGVQRSVSDNRHDLKTVPWYERTLARAGEFVIHRPESYNIPQGLELQADSPASATNHTSAYTLNQRAGAHDSYIQHSTSSSESSGNAYVIYGSQTALIPRDDVTLDNHTNGRGLGIVNHAYITQSTNTAEYYIKSADVRRENKARESEPKRNLNLNSRVNGNIVQDGAVFRGNVVEGKAAEFEDIGANNKRSVQTLIRRFESASSPERPVQVRKNTDQQYLSPKNLQNDYAHHVYLQPNSKSNSEYFIQSSKDYTSNIITGQDLGLDELLRKESAAGKHPTRPDTPVYNPQRFNDEQLSRCHQSNVENNPHGVAVGNGREESLVQPRYVNHINSYSEEKKIQDAFEFLDDMEE